MNWIHIKPGDQRVFPVEIKIKKDMLVCSGPTLHSLVSYSDVSLESGTTGLKVKISVKV